MPRWHFMLTHPVQFMFVRVEQMLISKLTVGVITVYAESDTLNTQQILNRDLLWVV